TGQVTHDALHVVETAKAAGAREIEWRAAGREVCRGFGLTIRQASAHERRVAPRASRLVHARTVLEEHVDEIALDASVRRRRAGGDQPERRAAAAVYVGLRIDFRAGLQQC